ncbi:MAG: ABC-F family ATP-binding cassette domain-containing protein, partial [bacterium]
AEDYERIQNQFRLNGGYDFEARTEKVLFGLGFTSSELDSPCSHLSGGQQSRLFLARTLLRPADLLLLDEPTNHLDVDGILWLASYLQAYKSALVLISHDREFLDTVTSITWELEGGKLYRYAAGFSASRRLREESRRLLEQEYERQQEWKLKTEQFIRRNLFGQKTKQAQARRKQLEKTEWITPPAQDKIAPRMKIPEARRGGALSFAIRNGSIGFDGNALIRNVQLRVLRGERVGILGGNGCGKTTLLRTIIGELHALEGEVEWGENNVPAYFAQETGTISQDDTVLDYLAKVNPIWTDLEIRKFAATFLFRADDVHKTLKMLSGGERSRLSLARLFSRTSNVLLLDEPTNHLDIRSRESLELAIRTFSGTVLVISHDLYFLREVVERCYLIRRGILHQLEKIEGLTAELMAPDPDLPAQDRDKKPPRKKDTSGLSKNERRRRERRLKELEEAIDHLENEKLEIQDTLHGGSQDHLLLTSISLRHKEIETSLSELLEEWAQLGAELQQ